LSKNLPHRVKNKRYALKKNGRDIHTVSQATKDKLRTINLQIQALKRNRNKETQKE